MIERVSLTDANKRYDELIEKASNGEKFVITRYGRETAVILSYEEFKSIAAESNDAPQPQDET